MTSTVYSLAIAVYCTSWTFYGSVGRATTGGMSFLTIYLGLELMSLALYALVAIRRDHAVSTLSGGNQQKVVIAKWLLTDARVILLNDPTRGIDVGTKQELYRLMRDLADQSGLKLRGK